nr:16S rRNA (uracil(1498)-N(3))-methyltransferase [uncultured Mogibacterium sp.]
MQQYFIYGSPSAETIEITDKDTIKHMFQVMRLRAGDEVVLVFQDGIKRLAEVVDAESRTMRIIEMLEDNVELPVNVTVACGFPKGDKFATIAQKSTELGAAEICGFPADRSIVKWDDKKLVKLAEKLEKVVQGAAEQSKRNIIPSINLVADKKSFIKSFNEYDKVFVACEEAAKDGEKSVLANALSEVSAGEKLLFIFGPEGGITDKEIEAFTEAGAVCIGLGPRIMRAETAPMYVLSAVSYALELSK